MKLFITLSKKGVAVALAVITIGFVCLSRVASIGQNKKDGSTNALRIDFISSLGYSADETAAEVKETVIPREFGTVYENYNLLQRSADFDLKPYSGQAVTVYTYSLTESENTRVNLIIFKGEIIGGDVSSTELDGEMLPLIHREKNKKDSADFTR